MGVYDDMAAAIRQRLDDEGERGVKVVPIIVSTLSPLTVKIQGSTVSHPARFIEGQYIPVGSAGYAIWKPGEVAPLVFSTTTDSWHIIGDPGEPAFGAGLSALGSPYKVPQFMREGRKVFLEGVFSASAIAINATLFTLPAGYRPVSGAVIVPCNVNADTGAASAGTAHTHPMNSMSARMTIATSGIVSYAGPSTLRSGSHLSMGSAYFTID